MNSVLKAAGYILAHTPDMVIHNGTTQTTERVVNPDSKYLKVLKDHIRTYDEVIKYPPNQAYIGNITPQQLKEYDNGNRYSYLSLTFTGDWRRKRILTQSLETAF